MQLRVSRLAFVSFNKWPGLRHWVPNSKSRNVVSQSSRTCCISWRNCNSLSIDKPMNYLSQKLQDDSENEGSFNPDRIVNNLLCVQHTNALSVQYFILNSSVCSEKSLNSHQYSLKHCSKHASRMERLTSADDWRSGKSPASKDIQFYWTCIPTDLCGFGWQTHPTRKAESLRRLCYSTPKSKPTVLPHDG